MDKRQISTSVATRVVDPLVAGRCVTIWHRPATRSSRRSAGAAACRAGHGRPRRRGRNGLDRRGARSPSGLRPQHPVEPARPDQAARWLAQRDRTRPRRGRSRARLRRMGLRFNALVVRLNSTDLLSVASISIRALRARRGWLSPAPACAAAPARRSAASRRLGGRSLAPSSPPSGLVRRPRRCASRRSLERGEVRLLVGRRERLALGQQRLAAPTRAAAPPRARGRRRGRRGRGSRSSSQAATAARRPSTSATRSCGRSTSARRRRSA